MIAKIKTLIASSLSIIPIITAQEVSAENSNKMQMQSQSSSSNSQTSENSITNHFILQGKTWPQNICDGQNTFPSGQQAIAKHGTDRDLAKSCPKSNFIIINEPANMPYIRHRQLADGRTAKTEFYDDSDSEMVHLAECFSGYGLPAPEISAVVNLKNGTELNINFNIEVCLGKTSDGFLDFLPASLPDFEHTFNQELSDANEAHCETDFAYMGDKAAKNDWTQRSTGILYHTLNKDWHNAEIICRASYYKNFTEGMVPEKAIADSHKISIQVVHPMETVELKVEQDMDGVVTDLQCFTVGGYPEPYLFNYILNQETLTREQIEGKFLPRNATLQCEANWRKGSHHVQKLSSIYKSIINEDIRSVNILNRTSQTGGFGFFLIGLFGAAFVLGSAIFFFKWFQKNRGSDDVMVAHSDDEQKEMMTQSDNSQKVNVEG